MIPSLAAAAQTQQGCSDLSGRVVDAQQVALPGVAVLVHNQGTNPYHGSAFLFFQDEKLAAKEYFARRADRSRLDAFLDVFCTLTERAERRQSARERRRVGDQGHRSLHPASFLSRPATIDECPTRTAQINLRSES